MTLGDMLSVGQSVNIVKEMLTFFLEFFKTKNIIKKFDEVV